EDILIEIGVCNRGPETAELHVLPTLWFRNTWMGEEGIAKPVMHAVSGAPSPAIAAAHPTLGGYFLYAEEVVPLLFTENETNCQRVFGQPNRSRYAKDGINDYVVGGVRDAINPERTGTKAALHYHVSVQASETRIIRLRLTTDQSSRPAAGRRAGFFQDFD